VRSRASVVALVVVAATAGIGAAQAPVAPARTAPALADLDRALSERLVGMAARNGGPQFAAGAARATGIVDPLENTDLWVAYLIPDLDGDGGTDVLDVRHSRDSAPEFTMQARSGRDGARLWRYESERQVSIPFLTRTADGAPGIGLYEVDYTLSATDWHFYVTSFDSRGKKLFDVELASHAYGPAGLLNAEPALHDILPAGAGEPTQLLLALDTQMPGVGVGGLSTSSHLLQVEAMSMTDASVTERGALLTTFGFPPRVQVVGDMTGDDRPDFVVTHGTYETHERNGVLVARASDGTDLWTRSGLLIGGLNSVMSALDVTGDGLDDVIINAYGSVGGAGLYINPGGDDVPDPLGIFGFPADVSRTVTLIEAAEGEVRWERPGLFAQQQGDLSGDGVADPMVWDVRTVGDEYEVRVAALTGLGDVVYDRALGRLAVSDTDPDWFGLGVWAVGDVTDDGTEDLLFALYADRGEDEVEERDGLADGRTAQVLRRDVGYPLFGSVDGHGADLQEFDFDDADHSGEILVTDGLSGRELVLLELERETDGFTSVVPADLDQDGCPELFLGTRRGPRVSDVYAFSLRSPDPLWALRRHDAGDTSDVGPVAVTSSPGLCRRVARSSGRPAPARPAPDAARPRAVPPPRTAPRPLPATGGSTVAPALLVALVLGTALATRVGLRRA
jgi:hypothetical protein